MPETFDAFDEIQRIRLRLDAIEQTQEMLVRANSAQVLADVDEMVARDPVAARVYLLVNGVMSQQEIARALGVSEATVSRRFDTLKDLHLVVLLERRAGTNVYRRSAADRILRLQQRIERELAVRHE